MSLFIFFVQLFLLWVYEVEYVVVFVESVRLHYVFDEYIMVVIALGDRGYNHQNIDTLQNHKQPEKIHTTGLNMAELKADYAIFPLYIFYLFHFHG